jgi:hypothetical protein
MGIKYLSLLVNNRPGCYPTKYYVMENKTKHNWKPSGGNSSVRHTELSANEMRVIVLVNFVSFYKIFNTIHFKFHRIFNLLQYLPRCLC